MTDNGIASIVRSLAEGVDPGRVLRDVAQEAMNRTATSSVVLAAMLEGQLTPIVAIGSPHPAMVEAGQEAHASGRPARRSDPALGLEALAVPVRHRGAVVAVLAVAGPGGVSLQTGTLTAAADCAALALAARPAASVLTGAGASDGGLALAEALVTLAAAETRDQVIAAALEVAAHRYGARAGFVCLPTGPGGVEVVGWRGLDRDRLGGASRHPGFTRLVSGTGVTVLAPTDPTVAQLTAGAEFAICLSLEADAGGTRRPRGEDTPPPPGGPGALVLLAPEEPDAGGRRALEALRVALSASLRAAQSAAAVEAADTRLASLVHTVADPVLMVDAAGRFTALNAAAAELFALSDAFEIGRDARGRLGHPALESLLLDDAAGLPGDAAEVVLGRPTPRRFVPAARSLAGGGRVLMLRPARDGTPAGRETDEAAAGLGRALRQPLAAIATLAGAAAASGGDWEVARKGILAEAARLEALADQLTLLTPESPGAATVTVRTEPLDVVAVASVVVGAHAAAAPGRSVALTGPPRLEARADRRLLERVLEPLLDNALRYSDGPVTVEVADRGETFEVAVVDTGPGIFSGDIPGLFERYHPLDGSPVRHGAGISLYTCRRLVELMGGRLWCDSRLGVGSRFAFRLPSF
jgi:signal transduction histidine kinase